MAFELLGTLASAADSRGKYRIYANAYHDPTLQDVANNRSYCRVDLYLDALTGDDFKGWNANAYLDVNGSRVWSLAGQQVPPVGATWNGPADYLLYSWTGWVYHTTDGSKSLPVAASYGTSTTSQSYLPGSTMSFSSSVALPDIPRGAADRYDGSTWPMQLLERWDGSQWKLQVLERWDGTSWVRQI